MFARIILTAQAKDETPAQKSESASGLTAGAGAAVSQTCRALRTQQQQPSSAWFHTLTPRPRRVLSSANEQPVLQSHSELVIGN
jgi:hypothetical protein